MKWIWRSLLAPVRKLPPLGSATDPPTYNFTTYNLDLIVKPQLNRAACSTNW